MRSWKHLHFTLFQLYPASLIPWTYVFFNIILTDKWWGPCCFICLWVSEIIKELRYFVKICSFHVTLWQRIRFRTFWDIQRYVAFFLFQPLIWAMYTFYYCDWSQFRKEPVFDHNTLSCQILSKSVRNFWVNR